MFNESMTITEFLEDYRKNKERFENVGTNRTSALSIMNKFSAKDFTKQKRFLSEMCDAFEYAISSANVITQLKSGITKSAYSFVSVDVFAERLRIVSADMNEDYISAMYTERYGNDTVACEMAKKMSEHFTCLMESPAVYRAYYNVKLPALTVAAVSNVGNEITAIIEKSKVDKTNIYESNIKMLFEDFGAENRMGWMIEEGFAVEPLHSRFADACTDGWNANTTNNEVVHSEDVIKPTELSDLVTIKFDTEGSFGVKPAPNHSECLHAKEANLNKTIMQFEYPHELSRALAVLGSKYIEYMDACELVTKCKDNTRYCALSMDIEYIDNLMETKLFPTMICIIHEYAENGYIGCHGHPLSTKVGDYEKNYALWVYEGDKELFLMTQFKTLQAKRARESERINNISLNGKRVDRVFEDTLEVFRCFANRELSLQEFITKYKD